MESQYSKKDPDWGSYASAYGIQGMSNRLSSINFTNNGDKPHRITSALHITSTFSRWICNQYLIPELVKNADEARVVTILDLASGPATAPIQLINLLSIHPDIIPGVTPQTIRLIITDLSSEMVEYSQQALSTVVTNNDGMKHLITYECHVMDAAKPMSIVMPQSASILTCMYGIMFVHDHRVALLEHYKALTSHGLAIYATWGNVGTMHIIEAFGVFCGIAPGTIYGAMNQAMRIGSDIEAFTRDLEDAGFQSIEIIQHREVFEIACNDNSINHFVVPGLLKNPLIKSFFEDMTEELLRSRWKEFMHSSHSSLWSIEEGNTAQIVMNSNIYIARTA